RALVKPRDGRWQPAHDMRYAFGPFVAPGWRLAGAYRARYTDEMRRAGLTAILLLSACQPQARRLLVLDLALSEPPLLNGTVQPWRDEGYNVEYRRFYPHLVRADL